MCTSLPESLIALGTRNTSHLTTRQNIPPGRTIIVIETRPTDTNDVINLEKKSKHMYYNESRNSSHIEEDLVPVRIYTLGHSDTFGW